MGEIKSNGIIGVESFVDGQTKLQEGRYLA